MHFSLENKADKNFEIIPSTVVELALEEDVDDAMEINSKLVVNSGETLAMLDKLQFFFKENDAENEV